jgi:hypothetical protein
MPNFVIVVIVLIFLLSFGLWGALKSGRSGGIKEKKRGTKSGQSEYPGERKI